MREPALRSRQKLVCRLVAGLVLLVSITPTNGSEWTDIWALGRAGVRAQEKKDYENARRNFDAAVQRHPNVAVAYFNRGRFLLSRGQYTLAVKDFDKAVSLRPTFWTYSYARGITYSLLGRYDLALADFNRLLSLHPGDDFRARLLNDRAWILATCPDARYRNGKQAVDDAKIAVRFAGRYKASYLDTLAAAYAESGDFDSAVEHQQKAIAAQTKTDRLVNADGALSAYRQHRPYRVDR